jgi:hypothetical protein
MRLIQRKKIRRAGERQSIVGLNGFMSKCYDNYYRRTGGAMFDNFSFCGIALLRHS